MATYDESEYLVGEELDNFLDEAFLDSGSEEGDHEDEVENVSDERETADRMCVCGKSATERMAKCRMIHFSCDINSQLSSDQGGEDSDESSSEYIDIVCQCCQMLIGTFINQFTQK